MCYTCIYWLDYIDKLYVLHILLDLHTYTLPNNLHICCVCATLECGELPIVYTPLLHYFNVSLVMLVGELPWMCRICSHGYKEPAVLRRHMDSRHGGSPGFQCIAECGELFKYQSQLVTHRKSCQKAQVGFSSSSVVKFLQQKAIFSRSEMEVQNSCVLRCVGELFVYQVEPCHHTRTCEKAQVSFRLHLLGLK